ncbi:MAG: hypothetical protein Q8O31_09035 [Rhodocyclaceae bacterium]|nr:hypothetical protein [Rhodocyclaceae bacterium]
MLSDVVVRVESPQLERMAALITAIERVIDLPSSSPALGVFFGYDFHLTPTGPKLIEINTNAGGALLAARQAGRTDVEEAFVAMFRAEAERAGRPLRSLAIVDDVPETQFLYPEFLAFRDLFERHGIQTVICDPRDLMLCHGSFWVEEIRIDLVYNRLTDFLLEAPVNAVLRQAWLDEAVVVTPNPHLYALYADKRNLVAWSNEPSLREGIPLTERVMPEHAADLWARRRQLFFKPATGYGAKAVYRGDKITRRVFEEVMRGDYIAQALVPPSTQEGFKVDIRNYVYDGRVQLVAARLWQGQTTNFRTPGGGFARVEGI